MREMEIKSAIEENFVCVKCDGNTPLLKEISAAGAGLSKIFNIQHNRFLVVSCQNCGYAELYDLNVLRNKTGLDGRDLADILFG